MDTARYWQRKILGRKTEGACRNRDLCKTRAINSEKSGAVRAYRHLAITNAGTMRACARVSVRWPADRYGVAHKNFKIYPPRDGRVAVNATATPRGCRRTRRRNSCRWLKGAFTPKTRSDVSDRRVANSLPPRV